MAGYITGILMLSFSSNKFNDPGFLLLLLSNYSSLFISYTLNHEIDFAVQKWKHFTCLFSTSPHMRIHFLLPAHINPVCHASHASDYWKGGLACWQQDCNI